MLATLNHECNGNILRVYKSDRQFDGYREVQRIEFGDNIARRAGAVFEVDGKLISPAQICNNAYGEGVSMQEVVYNDGRFSFVELRRDYPLSNKYKEGYHTYNVFNNNTIIIDGYRYGSKILRKIYLKIRSI